MAMSPNIKSFSSLVKKARKHWQPFLGKELACKAEIMNSGYLSTCFSSKLNSS